MKKLIDPVDRFEMKVQSVTLTTEDIKKLDEIMKDCKFKNRSSAMRACIFFAYNQIIERTDG
jgi:Arc/MetJ-type ribon-helix-helix transcriptional regulator